MLERKRTRLKEYDYSSPNYYFVTICSKNKADIFGKVANEKVYLSESGEIVKKCWMNLALDFKNLQIDEFIVMPNHFHAIVIVDGPVVAGSPLQDERVGSRLPRPYNEAKKYSLSQVIAYFKYQSTKLINEAKQAAGTKIWQRSFYDRIIRNEKELYNIRNYIRYNVLKWSDDFGDENLEL